MITDVFFTNGAVEVGISLCSLKVSSIGCTKLNKKNNFFQFFLSKDFWLCVLSAVLLIFAFPKIDLGILGWIGLVPLMLALEGKNSRQAFGLSYLCGIIFFTGTLYWFVYVDILVALIGAPLLILYLSLFFGLFGLIYSYFNRTPLFLKFVALPSAWVVLEWIRANFLTGFGWASLAHSQYKNLYFIQIADLTGIFGISFLMILVNLLGKELILCLKKESIFSFKQWLSNLFFPVLVILIVVLGYGVWRFSSLPNNLSQVKAAVIQGNILQGRKWLPSEWPTIMEEYIFLTKEAAKGNPQMIIWPETAFPGILWEDDAYLDKLKELTIQLQIPLVFGSVINEDEAYYNSALLISKQGEVAERYDKMHLVAFGEYVPLRSLLPFLSNVVPIGDFTAGEEFTIFPAPASFSVLICFEDTVSHLSREFVRRGAKILVNITNDAWFEDTKEPFLHLQSAVFRSVENRRTLIRAANTGVSSFIDPLGRIVKTVERQGKKTYVSGYAIASMPLNNTLTFYTRFGDVFVYLCMVIVLCGVLLKRWKIL